MSGIWDEREVSYHENPEKRLLIMIYDRQGEEVKGMATLMTKFFSVEGDAYNLASEMEHNTVLIQKKTPEFKGSFLALVTDPVYVEYTPRNLINQVAEMYERIDEMSEEALRRSRDYNLDLVDIEHTPEEDVKELLGEPLALPVALVRKVGPGTVMETPTGRVFLGIDVEREPVKEDVRTFGLTVISGDDTRQAAHVVMEGYIMNGVAGLIFDRKEEFTQMDTPNKDAQFLQEYGEELEPLSMPVRNFTPGQDVFIDLTVMNERLFAGIAGVSDKSTTTLIGRILDERKVKTLSEIADRLSRVTDEDKKYYAARGARICRLLDDVYPGVFNGSVEAKEILAPWMRRIGRIARVDIRGMDDRLVKGIIYSVLRTVYEELRREAASEELKIGVLMEGPEMVSGKGDYLDQEINALVKLCTSAGIGMCIRTPHENELDRDLIMNATARITAMEKNQLSVKTQAKKPYRVILRPTLSGA